MDVSFFFFLFSFLLSSKLTLVYGTVTGRCFGVISTMCCAGGFSGWEREGGRGLSTYVVKYQAYDRLHYILHIIIKGAI